MKYKEYGPYETKEGYLFINRRFSDGRSRSIYLHRMVMMEKLGRDLNSNEVVHHIDGNKKNNSIENLELTTASEHARIHRKEMEHIECTCPECGSEFKAIAYKVRDNQGKRKKAGPFCGKSCAGKYSQRLGPKKEIKHGTLSAYRYGRCRCDSCRKANTESARKRRERLRAPI